MQVITATHIEARPDRCGGRPCIVGTRIRVHDIYVWHVLDGLSPVEILAEKPELSNTIVILVAIPETMTILGFVVAMMLILRAG